MIAPIPENIKYSLSFFRVVSENKERSPNRNTGNTDSVLKKNEVVAKIPETNENILKFESLISILILFEKGIESKNIQMIIKVNY